MTYFDIRSIIFDYFHLKGQSELGLKILDRRGWFVEHLEHFANQIKSKYEYSIDDLRDCIL